MNRNTTTYWGEGTNDEMCNSVVIIYPAVKNFDYCMQYIDVDICTLAPQLSFKACNASSFFYLAGAAGQVCDMTCSAACLNVLNAMTGTMCLSGDTGLFLNSYYAPASLAQLLQLRGYCIATAGQNTPPGLPGSPMSTMSTLVEEGNIGSTQGNKIRVCRSASDGAKAVLNKTHFLLMVVFGAFKLKWELCNV